MHMHCHVYVYIYFSIRYSLHSTHPNIIDNVQSPLEGEVMVLFVLLARAKHAAHKVLFLAIDKLVIEQHKLVLTRAVAAHLELH
jgi:hypothetical protein